MRIFICGGKSEADFVISAFDKKDNHLVVMSEDYDTGKMLSERHGIDVLISDPLKIYSFESAGIENFDLVVSLLERDVDNFVVCRLCKDVFHVHKAICTVNNPSKVVSFRMMGIDSPISASYLLADQIEGESNVDSLVKSLSLENKKVVITEIKIQANFACVNQSLKNLDLPKEGNICCIFRDPQVLIPRGDTVIKSGDTLIVASALLEQAKVIAFLRRE
jgi:trk system potassium uptake protein TrkA